MTIILLVEFVKSLLLILKSILDHLLFVDFLKRSSVLESEIAKHLEQSLSNVLEVDVALALSELIQERVLVLEHLVHVVTVLFLSATVVLSNLLVDLIEVLSNQLVQVRQILELVELILGLLEVLLQVDGGTFTLHSQLVLLLLDLGFESLCDQHDKQAKTNEECWDTVDPISK